jgi:hypothetical protein
MTYHRDDFEELRKEGRRDVLYSEGFLFEVRCHVAPSGIGRGTRLEWAERKDGLAAEGMSGDPRMRDRSYLGAGSGGENRWKSRFGVLDCRETLG